MTYPQCRASLETDRTKLQDAKHRIDTLEPEIVEILILGGNLLGQIPPDQFGDPEEAPQDFADAVTAASNLATTLSARILPE